MDNEILKIKKLKDYRNVFWVFSILTYAIGRAGEIIKQSDGTSEGIAIFIIARRACQILRENTTWIVPPSKTTAAM